MKKTKTIGLILLPFVLFCFFLFSTTEVKADLLGWEKATKAGETAGYDASTGVTTFSGTIGTAINAVLSLLGVFFLILMAYAGYTWLMARGEEAEVEKAQKIIMAAVIGLVIVVAAYSITTFVVPKILHRTGEGGSAAEVGASKVECCKICGWAFSITCPKKQVTEAECTELEGDYQGLVPAGECK
ncbi:MAG: hypothetical protein HY980_04155 [Candidatus Magasanikbacteria bacterium]|nr:hypothetical protein [Candidatus Magasanikbacteria bacterium]